MTKAEFAAQAAAACASAENGAHIPGQAGNPYWNTFAFQFMYVPAFQFSPLPGVKKYRFIAADETGAEHIFEADKCTADLSPIWAELPEGVVTLHVFALDAEGNPTAQVGTRTFFRLSPFPDDLPERVCTYREAASRGVEYTMTQSFMLHWLTEGTPDPDYDHNVYPSKMIASIIKAMITYAGDRPENAEKAMKIAVNAADYLLGITAKEGPMAWIPPTYQIDFRPNPETRSNLAAKKRLNWVMMMYPATVGDAYLALAKATGEQKYFYAALKIAEHFRDTVQPNGSWYLIRDIHTGEVLAGDYVEPLREIVPLLTEIYTLTCDECWKQLADNAIAYVENTVLTAWNWGGQFEDSHTSLNYSNLSHYPATALIRYYCSRYPNDADRMAKADEMMRWVEDQFIIWKRPSPWNRSGFDTAKWHTPCGCEQYEWHVPIDASTADMVMTFLAMHKAGRGDLHLEKAKALADSLTRAQQPDGLIPTHWMTEKYMKGYGMWINCLFYATRALSELADFLGE